MKLFEYLPELEGEEAQYVHQLMDQMHPDSRETFAKIYRARRKDPIIMLFLALIGLFGIAGIHRFMAGQVGMGILYVFTAGLCVVGTIVDMINYKNFAFEYNRNVATDIVRELNL